VAAGGNSGKPLFTVSDIHKVRIYVNVPQAFLAELKPGLAASLVLPQYPGQPFSAELTTTSNSVAPDSRSALVELLADNPEGKLWPGSFAEVHFHLDAKGNVLRIPTTALFFGPRGIELALLMPDGKVSLSKSSSAAISAARSKSCPGCPPTQPSSTARRSLSSPARRSALPAGSRSRPFPRTTS
jgi:multidrug efflux pump subunit AcrA (membrane-fusion protein)